MHSASQLATRTSGRLPSANSSTVHRRGTTTQLPRLVATSSSSHFLAPAGQVRHDLLTDPNWIHQLGDMLHVYGRMRKKNFRTTSAEVTLENRRDILNKTFRLIMADKGFTSLSQVKPRHIARIIELWREAGVSARAIRNYYWHLGWFFSVCGIQIGSIAQYASYPGEFVVRSAASRDLSWTGNNVSIDDVIERIEQEDPVAARLMITMRTFGLRPKESVCLTPHEADRIDGLAITKGSKTGRARLVPYEILQEQNFRKLLDDLKGQVEPGVHLAWSNRTLKQAMRRIYHLMAKHGVTRKDLGVTLYGLRHEFAIDTLEKLAGVKAPVRGGLVINYQALGEARRKVSQAMGHNRSKVTTAYYGSFISLEREQLRRAETSWKRLQNTLDDVGVILRGEGVDNLYWIGKRSVGANTTQEPYEFVLPPGVDAALANKLAGAVSNLIVGATGYDCSVRAWEALAHSQQVLYQNEAVPLFSGAKSPFEIMQERLEESRAMRLQLSKTNKDGACGVDTLAC